MEEGMSGFHVKSSWNSGCGGGVVAGGGGAKCGRWNPTSEQVKVLTELFRSGLRTPSTDQIQKISSQLSFYGKIESKNVFYWFQNHKARERQKRRRVFVDAVDHHHQNEVRVLSDDHRVSCTKHFGEMKEGSDQERVIETLQLFPLNKYEYSEPEKVRAFGNECKENESPFATYSFGTTDQLMDHHHHPPLDLRLSFV